MLYIYIFIVLIFFFKKLPSTTTTTRTDLDQTHYIATYNDSSLPCSPSNEDLNIVYCPEGSWVSGFFTKFAVTVGMQTIYLNCTDHYNNTVSLAYYYKITLNSYYSYNSTIVFCPNSNEFVVGFKLRGLCPLNGAEFGVIDLNMTCGFGSTIANNMYESYLSIYTPDWYEKEVCTSGSAVCGYKYYYGDASKLQAVYIKAQCCLICDNGNGFYFDAVTKNCLFCDMNCKECQGNSKNCITCPTDFVLNTTSFVCIPLENSITLVQAFFNTFDLTDWSYSSKAAMTSCSPFFFIGGFNVFSGSDAWISLTVGLHTHFKLRLRFHFFCIDIWNPEASVNLYYDDVLQGSINCAYNRTMYYGQDCGNHNFITNTKKVGFLFNHTASSIEIKINTTNLSVGYWAINRFMLDEYLCDMSCQSCEGAASQCTSCNTGMQLNSNKGCDFKCNPDFYDGTTCSSSCSSNQVEDPTTYTCQTSCPNGTYFDQTINMCQLCDLVCKQCNISSKNCTQCWLDSRYQLNPPDCKFQPSLLPLALNMLGNPDWGISSLYPNWELQLTKSYLDELTCDSPSPFTTNYTTYFNYQDKVKKIFNISNPYTEILISFFLIKYSYWGNNDIIISLKYQNSEVLKVDYSYFYWMYNIEKTVYKLCNYSENHALVLTKKMPFRLEIPFFESQLSPLELDIYTSFQTTYVDCSDCLWGIYDLSLLVLTCHISCKTCNAANQSNACTSCASGYYFLSSSHSCVTVCPAYTYMDNVTYTCSPYICGDGMYFDPVGLLCMACNATCKTCSVSGSSGCTTCISTLYLKSPTGPSECVSCSINQYFDSTTYQCQLCDTSCSTCSQSGINGCLSCLNTYLQSSDGPSSCLSTCPSGTYKSLDYKCLSCDASCGECQGNSSNDCLSCHSSYFLSLPTGPGVCVKECANGYYPNQSKYVCELCDSSCFQCNSSGISNCTSCKPFTYLQNPPYPSSCLSTCPYGTYQDDITNLCQPCDSSCFNCSASGLSDCLSCKNLTYLQNSPGPSFCLSTCPSGTYKTSDNTCLFCDTTCTECSNECTTCNDTNVFDEGICIHSCPINKFANSNRICVLCDNNCQQCLSLTACEICLPGFSLNETKQCQNETKQGQNKTEISFYVIEINNPINFEIVFSTNSDYIENNIKDILELSLIKNISNSDLNISFISILNSSSDTNSYFITLGFNQGFLSKENYLSVNLNINNSNLDYNFINNSEIISLNEYKICSSDEFYNSSSKICIMKPKLSQNIEYTSVDLQYLLKFTYLNDYLRQNIYNLSNISIQGVKNTDYRYSFQYTTNELNFIIQLTTNISFINGPLLIYYLLIPEDIIQSQNLNIISNSTYIKMFDYNIISKDVQKVIESTKTQTSITSYIASGSIYANSAAASGTPFLLQGMMLTELIYLIKFIDINYPTNARQIFKAESKVMTIFFFYDFQVADEDQKNLPKKFLYYDVSPYVLDNCADLVLKNLAILTFVFFLTLLLEKKKESKSIFIKILRKIHSIIVWEIVLFFMLLNMQKFVFYIFCNLMFNSFNTFNGKINLILASVFLMFEFFFLLHLLSIFNKIKNIKQINNDGSVNSRDNSDAQPLRSKNTFEESNKDSDKDPLSLRPVSIDQDHEENLKINAWNFNNSFSTNTSPKLYKKSVLKASVSPNDAKSEKKPESSTIMQRKIISSWLHNLKEWFFKSKIIRYIYFPVDHENFLKQYEFMHEDVSCNGIMQIYYVFFDYLRQVLLSIFAVVFYFAPFQQIVLINFINCGFIAYYIYAFPYKSKILFFVSLISELITESALASAFVLAIFDRNQESKEDTRFILGWIIVGANLGLLYWIGFAGLVKLSLKIYEIRKNSKVQTIINS